MIFQKRTKARFVIAILLLASLSCRFFSQPAAIPTPTQALLPATFEPLNPAQGPALATSEPTQISGQVQVSVDEDQLTAILKEQLKDQKDPQLENPQVLLRDGQVQVLGSVKQGALTLPLKMVIDVSADSQGKPHYQIASAGLGPLPLPQSTLDQLTAELDKALSENMPAEFQDIFIEDISIANGVMTVKGHRR